MEASREGDGSEWDGDGGSHVPRQPREGSVTESEAELSAPVFEPNPDLVAVITNLGYSQNAAIKALFYTGNYSADLAVGWLLENEGANLDAPIQDSLLVEEEDTDDDDEDGGAGAGEEEHKMVLVVNTELKMGIGKVAAQVAHAAVALHRMMLQDQEKYADILVSWTAMGEMKVVVRGQSTTHLTQLASAASAQGLPYYLVRDAGRTQIAPGSMTVLGIIGKSSDVDLVTGGLKLL